MRSTVACLLISVLPACISFTREPPATTRYVLDANRDSDPHASRRGPAIEVRQLHASPAYGGRKLVFRTGADTVDIDFYSEFWVPPGSAVTAALREWLSASSAFTTVRAGSLVKPAWIVEGDVVEVYGDERGDPAAVLAVHLLVVEPDTNRVVLEQTFRAREALESSSPPIVMSGLRECLRRILTEIEQTLVARYS